MNQTSSAAAPVGASKVRKLAMQMVAGAAVGASVTFGLLTFVGKSRFDLDDPSRVIALVTGLVFALTGLVVGLGVMAPKSGAHLLNVEDAEELREQRGPLWRLRLSWCCLASRCWRSLLAASTDRRACSRPMRRQSLGRAVSPEW